MHLIENKYETAGLMLLPPHARDVAEHLLTVTPLSELLLLLEAEEPHYELLTQFKVPKEYWNDIIHATLLAKATYFLPNQDFSREEVLYLVKTACIAIKMPLDTYSITEVIEAKEHDYPIFTHWLKQLAKLLQAEKLRA